MSLSGYYFELAGSFGSDSTEMQSHDAKQKINLDMGPIDRTSLTFAFAAQKRFGSRPCTIRQKTSAWRCL